MKPAVGSPPDLDATRGVELTLVDYLDHLALRLAAGWGGFTGTVEELEPAQPVGVPDDYVMRPFHIRLAYRGRHWLKVTFELGHDEIGSTTRREERIAADIVALFSELGLDEPSPIAVLALDHQIAQKLHACTSIGTRSNGNDRAHDLVDLQILVAEEVLDLAQIAATGARLFAARRQHAWPPLVVEHDRWPTLYADAAEGLEVLPTATGAVAWANALVAQIVAATKPATA